MGTLPYSFHNNNTIFTKLFISIPTSACNAYILTMNIVEKMQQVSCPGMNSRLLNLLQGTLTDQNTLSRQRSVL